MERILDKCPKCASTDVYHFYSGNGIFDKDGKFIEFDNNGFYEATQCQICGWDNF